MARGKDTVVGFVREEIVAAVHFLWNINPDHTDEGDWEVRSVEDPHIITHAQTSFPKLIIEGEYKELGKQKGSSEPQQ